MMTSTSLDAPNNEVKSSSVSPSHDRDNSQMACYYPDGPTLSLLWSREPLVGQSLYLGGEEGCDGNIYCIPGHAPRVLKIDTVTDEVYPIGPTFHGKFKWLRGVRVDDVIYGLPCHADSVLRIDVPTGSITTIPIPYEELYNNKEEAQEQRDMTWKYHGGTTCPLDGCIYTIPQSAWHVLRINPQTDTCDFVGPTLKGRWKWYGGVVGKQDSAIYGIPHNSPSVLRIDPSSDTDIVTLHGNYGDGGHKWHGAAAAPNGTIVSVPANADTVLCITPARPEPILVELGGPETCQTGRHRSDRKYKYLGAMTGTDGKVYCFPSGAERVLQVNVGDAASVRMVGPNLYDAQMERLHQNKWQNGLTSVTEQCVYAIPLSAETVLRIDTSSKEEEPKVTTWKLPSPYEGLAKWEGGVLASGNGVMYCVPNNHKAVLRISSGGVKTTDTSTKCDESSSLPVEAEHTSSRQEQHCPQDQSSPSNGNKTKSSNETETDNDYRYTTGIATLRSSAHRVKFPLKHRKHDPKPRNRKGQETHTTFLPPDICKETTLSYDVLSYDFKSSLVALLENCNDEMIGSFRTENGTSTSTVSRRLEDFVVPTQSLSRSSYGGHCEAAQKYLSDAVASDATFLQLFDRFVTEVVLPHLKRRLVTSGSIPDDHGTIAFYYQRPPTLRLQPGPARAIVKAHNDEEYGHQNGELNFWMPLTGSMTGVDLWCESSHGIGDYRPLPAEYGEVVSFHGSSCRHYVNANRTEYTRASLDFRVGVEGFYDPQWQMLGTTDDHSRQEVRL